MMRPAARKIQPDKVTLAREARGLTQGELAGRLGLSQAKVSKVEAGLTQGEGPLAENLSRALDYPTDFFFQTDPVVGAGPNELYHRKRQSAGSKLLRKVYAGVNLQRMHVARLLRSLELTSDVPRLSADEFNSPEQAARALRATWHVPAGPIENLVALIESHGAVIVESHFGSPTIDAISQMFPPLPPMFFMNAEACRSRKRLTLAHELGHIVMHTLPNPEMEDEANRFAAEFLMPEREIGPQLAGLNLQRLAELKLYWKASMAAILHRASDLGRVSRDVATHLWMRLSKEGYRKREPLELDLPDERPTLLREMIETHRRALTYSVDDLGVLMHLSPDELRQTYLPEEGRFKLVPKRA